MDSFLDLNDALIIIHTNVNGCFIFPNVIKHQKYYFKQYPLNKVHLKRNRFNIINWLQTKTKQ